MTDKSNYIGDGMVEVTSLIADDFRVIDNFALNTNELINLTGGVPPPLIRELELKVVSQSDTVIEIFVKTARYEVVRVIDFADKIIFNTHMYDYRNG